MPDLLPEDSVQATAQATAVPQTMQAIVQDEYGAPELVLREATVSVPAPGLHDVLVKVRASAVNALDWHFTAGEPMFARLTLGLRHPKRRTPGNDLSGTVVAVGAAVTEWQPGDQVFGAVDGGCFAEYVVAPAAALVPRPERLSLEDSAAVGVAALTALQGLRDWAGLQPGWSVLVNGASGGVGTFAIQIAKALGASHVTAVCSTPNVEQARALGADEVVDYRSSDVTQLSRRFDLIFDNAGSTTIRQAKRLLTDAGTYVMVTAPKSKWLKPLPRMLATPLFYVGGQRRAVVGKVARNDTGDLLTLRAWVGEGLVRPVIEARFPLADGPEVIRKQGEFHARGKTLVVP